MMEYLSDICFIANEWDQLGSTVLIVGKGLDINALLP